MSYLSRLTCTLIGLVLATASLAGSVLGDWPQFRGPNSSGVATGSAPPVEFRPGKNELWRLPLESGHSSPCVVGHWIFLTTYHEKQKKLAVVCIDRSRGEIRWQQGVPADRIEKGHPSFNPASSTPTSDGERVVAYFGSFGLICFDVNGQKLWELRMPLTKSFGGNATSPAIVGDRVFLYRGNYVDHFLVAVDKVTGKELWKVAQDEPINGEMACTACPIVAGDKLIVHTARSMQAFDIASGKQIWVTKCATTATSTPVLVGNEVIVAAWNKMGEPALKPSFPGFDELIDKHDKDGDKLISRDEFPTLWIFHRPEGAEAPMNGGTIGFGHTDRNKDQKITADEWSAQIRGLERFRAQYDTHGMLAIRLDSEGIVDADKIRTLETTGIPEVPSPLSDGDHVYFVKNGGVLTCLDLKTGKRVYRMRTGGRGTHYASPLIADGKLFTVAGDGRITVLTLGPDPEILATNDMDDLVYATPAIVDGSIYVRTHSALFAFGLAKRAEDRPQKDSKPHWEMGPFVKRGKPILSPTRDSRFNCPVRGKEVRWEAQNTYNPAAVVRDGKVYLFYRADDKSPDLKWGRTCRIGMAYSDDGIHFTRHPAPVIYPDNDVWKQYEWEGGCEDLHIVEGEDGRYYMNYTTWTGQRDTMSIASSRDLIQWTKHGPAFRKVGKIGGRSGVVVSRLVDGRLVAAKIKDKYWMYYTHPCALAWSDDLIDWTPQERAVWSGGHEAGAVALLRDDGILLMFNTMDWPSRGIWTLGQAQIDRTDLTTVRRHQDQPFLYPELEWERKGFIDRTTVANALVPFNGQWLLYYGAADRHIGLATFTPEADSPFALAVAGPTRTPAEGRPDSTTAAETR